MKLIDLNENSLRPLKSNKKMGRLPSIAKLGKMEKTYGRNKWNREDYDKKRGPVEVYAELSKKQYRLIQSGEYAIEVPYGVSMANRAGSRALRFFCPDIETAQELIEGLEVSNINWQEEFDGVEVIK